MLIKYNFVICQKEEDVILKEAYRKEMIERLSRLEGRSYNLRALLHSLGFDYIGPSEEEVSFITKSQLTNYMIDYYNCILKTDLYILKI